MSRRRQHVPWKAAGQTSELESSADEVVRETGWVFNNRNDHLSLSEFVRTGDLETLAYFEAFGLSTPMSAGADFNEQTIVEIGSGIGRMTASLTRMFAKVIACDLDAAFLERCRETVAQFGRADRLQTSHVADGRSLALPDNCADVVFSYITFQHCHRGDALALTREALRVAKPGGYVVLNYRTWVTADVALWPAGAMVRALWRLPRLGPVIARQRVAARLGWQANRLAPVDVVPEVGSRLTNVQVWRSPRRRAFGLPHSTDATFHGVHPSHWWLVATVR
ncbi:MAG: hypothetical protein RLY45_864 [Actinomycetota bacterium]|jgi:SAM-dependent methyltransferase